MRLVGITKLNIKSSFFNFQKGAMSKHFGFVFILTVLLSGSVLPANILFFFPGGNISHKSSVWPWVLALAKQGHNVTFLSPHSKTPTTHPNIVDQAPKPLQKIMSPMYQMDRFKERDSGLEKDFDYNLNALATCKVVVDNIETDPILRSLFLDSKFDLVVINALFGECGFYASLYFKAKTVVYTPCTFLTWYYDTYGVSTEAAWIPDLIYASQNIPITLWDRIYGSLMSPYWVWSRGHFSSKLEDAVKPLFKQDSLPSLYELENNASIVLISSHVATDFARTLPPLFVDIGGMTNWEPEKEIPKKFNDYMDTSGSGGVVLINFGSTVLLNAVSTRYQAMFFHLIHEFPNVKFIMRWSGPLPKFLDELPNNLMVSEWLPQREILRHPNLKIFITHGGISSIHEATYYGVPMIVLPLFADQDYNAYRIQAQQVGIRLEIRGMTGDTLVQAVSTVLDDDTFKKNTMKKSAIFRDRPQTPVETAVFWTEFAIRHNDTISTLRPMNQHLNSFQRRLLDVYLFLAVVLIVVSVLMMFLIKALLFHLCTIVGLLICRKNRSNQNQKTKRQKTE